MRCIVFGVFGGYRFRDNEKQLKVNYHSHSSKLIKAKKTKVVAMEMISDQNNVPIEAYVHKT